MVPMEDCRLRSMIQTCCRSPEVCSDNFYKPLRKTCLADQSLDNFQAYMGQQLQTTMKFSHVWLHQQVPQCGEFKRFFHQKNQKVQNPLLFWPQWSYMDHEGIARVSLSTRPSSEKQIKVKCRHSGHSIGAEKHPSSMPWDLEWRTHKWGTSCLSWLQTVLWGEGGGGTKLTTNVFEYPGKK